jgi:hypothetical protein
MKLPLADAEFARSQMVIVPAFGMVWESSGEGGVGASTDCVGRITVDRTEA